MTLIRQLDKLYYNEPKGEYGASIGLVGADGTKAYCNNADVALAFLKDNGIYERRTVDKKDGGTFQKMQVLKHVDLEVDGKSISFADGQSTSVALGGATGFTTLMALRKRCLREAVAQLDDFGITDGPSIVSWAHGHAIECAKNGITADDGFSGKPAAVGEPEDSDLPF